MKIDIIKEEVLILGILIGGFIIGYLFIKHYSPI